MIFQMNGIEFLIVYGGTIILMIALVLILKIIQLKSDKSSHDPDYSLHPVDPYFIAYLRGGVDSVLQTVLFSLHEKKLIGISHKNIIDAPIPENLSPIETTVLNGIITSNIDIEHKTQDYRALKAVLDPFIEPYQKKQLRKGFLEWNHLTQ